MYISCPFECMVSCDQSCKCIHILSYDKFLKSSYTEFVNLTLLHISDYIVVLKSINICIKVEQITKCSIMQSSRDSVSKCEQCEYVGWNKVSISSAIALKKSRRVN